MSHKKMLQCSMGALLLLLPWFGGLVLGEISNNFSQCLDFFYKETPPTGIVGQGYQPICQRYQNRYRFATLYHRQHRSPLYSAYILSPPEGKLRKGKLRKTKRVWLFEPQLAFPGADPEMEDPLISMYQNVTESQAVEEDYKDTNYTRGHLNPNQHQGIAHYRQATFTLTNIVPQHKGSNNRPWNDFEGEVLRKFNSYCNETMYVITGVMPYRPEPLLMKGRVSVPEYMWSAYCCPSLKAKLPRDMKASFPTYAAVGRNDPNSGDEVVPVNVNGREVNRGYEVRRMSLEDLETILSRRLGGTINLFNGQCK